MDLRWKTRATDVFVKGFIAYHRRDMETARARLAVLSELLEVHTGEPVVTIMRDELKAMLLLDEGRHEDAIKLLRGATEMESAMAFDYGPPSPVKPSFELLGEVLLEMGQPEEAQVAFEQSLLRAPGRTLSLAGLREATGRSEDGTATERAEWELEKKSAAYQDR